MTKGIGVVLFFCASACGGNPAKTAHDEHVDYVNCLKKDWYPGVTDPKQARINVVVQFRDQTTKYQPKDMCMSIDGRPLLSTAS